MHPDSELLRRYLEQKSESAFTHLVQQHIGLVYSVALRRVGGDAHLAEDVTQQVFADLARKAPSLAGRPTLGGWLYASALLASAAVVRREHRRKTREAAAHSMQSTLASSSSDDADWASLRPVIDEVVIALKDEEREAIALRFFDQRSFAEIGAALRVTDEAARKRVDRALEKLRTLLARRGITSTAVALGLALGTIGAATAPAALSAKIAAQALTTAPAGASIGAIGNMLWPAAAALIVGSILLSTQSNTNAGLRSEIARAMAGQSALARMQAENDRLARDIAALSAARPAPPPRAAPPAPPPPAARPVNARITVSPQGTIAWNGEPVSLRDFLVRLRSLQATGDPEGRIHIRGVGAEFSPLTYVIDEVRKAQLPHVTIESTAKPDPASQPQWFWF